MVVKGASWSSLESAAPELAASGRSLIYRGDAGEVLLVTVRDDQPPRIHPINAGIVGGALVAFLLPGAKTRDLELDGRYAMHTHQDPAAPSEFSVRGRARSVADPSVRAAAAAVWPFDVDDTYTLFEFDIETALLGSRPTADDWPPIYTSWKVTA